MSRANGGNGGSMTAEAEEQGQMHVCAEQLVRVGQHRQHGDHCRSQASRGRGGLGGVEERVGRLGQHLPPGVHNVVTQRRRQRQPGRRLGLSGRDQQPPGAVCLCGVIPSRGTPQDAPVTGGAVFGETVILLTPTLHAY